VVKYNDGAGLEELHAAALVVQIALDTGRETANLDKITKNLADSIFASFILEF